MRRRLWLSTGSTLLALLWAAAPPAGAEEAALELSRRNVREGVPIWFGSGWRYHPGDHPSFADPHFDDRSWRVVNPDLSGSHRRRPGGYRLPSEGGPAVGWFRLHLLVDSSLAGKTLGLNLYRTLGAAEVYLDGVPVLGAGSVAESGQEATVSRPIGPKEIRLAAGAHVIAIRYSLAGAEKRADRFGLGAMGFLLGAERVEHPGEYLADPVRSESGSLMFFVGLLAALGMIHLVLFLFLPRGSADHLYFAVFALLFAGQTLLIYRMQFSADVESFYSFRAAIVLVTMPLTAIAAARFLYAIRDSRLPWHFWVLCGAAAGGSVLYLIAPGALWTLSYLVVVPILAWVVVSAFVRRKQGARIIGVGFFALLLPWVYMALSSLGLVPPLTIRYAQFYGVIGLAGAMSVYLARNHARTSRNLEVLTRELEETNQELEKRVEDRTRDLTASERKYRGLIETANDGIVLLDLDTLRILDANRAAERLLGVDRRTLLTTHFTAFCPDLERLERCHRSLRAGLAIQEELEILRPDGREIPVEISASPFDLDGAAAIQGILHDIADRKQVEHAVQHARDMAEAASQTKSQFLANMSHELRTPLNAIIGYSEMLTEEVEERGYSELSPDLMKIHSAGQHLLGLINDVLDLSKVEAGKMELYLETFDVDHLLQGVVDTIRPLVEARGNELRVVAAPNLGTMRADQVKVRQILLNLLSNASKFTERGVITLSVERPESDPGTFILRVSDSGIGMTTEQMSRLFQPFTQADASVTRRFGGTGLGLTITQRFAQLMGGSVRVESEPGSGTTFTVLLPAEVREPTPPPQPTGRAAGSRTQPAIEHGRTGGGGTVLVIDDEPHAREMVERMLEREGFRVLTASTGQEGLQLAREERPDVITLDVVMLGLDGWAVLSALKADPELHDIPVVILTVTDNRNLGYALGAADYLTKPVNRERLVEILRRHRPPTNAATVLVVEDEPDTREMLRRSLQREGWNVVEAEDGTAALEQMETVRPAVVLLDLMMPRMDGFEFLEKLRGLENGSRIPVVILTSKDITIEDRTRLDGSVQRIIQKSEYRRQDLTREVRRLLETAHRS